LPELDVSRRKFDSPGGFAGQVTLMERDPALPPSVPRKPRFLHLLEPYNHLENPLAPPMHRRFRAAPCVRDLLRYAFPLLLGTRSGCVCIPDMYTRHLLASGISEALENVVAIPDAKSAVCKSVYRFLHISRPHPERQSELFVLAFAH